MLCDVGEYSRGVYVHLRPGRGNGGDCQGTVAPRSVGYSRVLGLDVLAAVWYTDVRTLEIAEGARSMTATAMTYQTIDVQDLKPAYDSYGNFSRRVLLQDDIFAYRDAAKRNSLPNRDAFGYEMAYFVATVEKRSSWIYQDDDSVTEYSTIEVDGYGDPFVREMTGDVLCGYCAGFARDEAYFVGYQINGEIGDEENVYCADCGEVIYETWKNDTTENNDDDDNRDEWLVGEER